MTTHFSKDFHWTHYHTPQASCTPPLFPTTFSTPSIPPLGPLTLNSTGWHSHFLKIDRRHEACHHNRKYHWHGIFLYSTTDIGLFQNRQKKCKNNDRGHWHFFKSTWDIWDPPSRAPPLLPPSRVTRSISRRPRDPFRPSQCIPLWGPCPQLPWQRRVFWQQ